MLIASCSHRYAFFVSTYDMAGCRNILHFCPDFSLSLFPVIAALTPPPPLFFSWCSLTLPEVSIDLSSETFACALGAQ